MIPAASSPPRLATLVMVTALSVLSLNMFLPSLANIAETFEADYALVNLAIAGYLALTAVLQLVMGPLSDRYGRRPVMLWGLTVFIVASLGCLMASNIHVFLGFRLLQGVVISGWVVSLAVIRDTTANRETAASLIGYVTMAMAIAPMLGPVFGGVLDELFGWRSTFMVLTGLGVIVLAMVWLDLGETNMEPSTTFGQQFRAYPELVRSPLFWGYALCMMFSTGAFYAFLTGAPLVAEAVLDMSTLTLGLFMGSITCGFMFGSFLSGRYSRRTSLAAMMIGGRLVACAGLIAGLVLFGLGVDHAAALFGPVMLVGVGNGITMPSCSAGILSVKPGLAGSASGLAGALIVAGGAVLSSITAEFVTEQTGIPGLLGVMLMCSALGLAAAYSVLLAGRREAD